jgi:hypothetical protein
MRSTIKAGGATVGITGGAGIVVLGIAGASGMVEAVALSLAEATLLAGELERAVWVSRKAAEAAHAAECVAAAELEAAHLGVEL